MEKQKRPSLLPQKRTNLQLRSSKAPTSSQGVLVYTNPTGRGTSSSDIVGSPPNEPTDADLETHRSENGRSTSRRVAEQQPLANIGRSLSLKKPEAREIKGEQRMPSTGRGVPYARTSRIAAPSARNSKAQGTEISGDSGAHIDQSAVDNLAVRNQSSSTTRSQSSSTSHAEASMPNIAITRHARISSQQLPDSRHPRPFLSSIPEAPGGSKPAAPTKPAFSTMQQHFTPKKASKALTSSFLTQPSHEQLSIEKASAETTSLQAELARLHLLHRSSASVQRAWEESARTHTEMQFDKVSREDAYIKKLSSYHVTLSNYPALRDWSHGIPTVEFAERLQSLSQTLFEIKKYMSPDSRYNDVLQTFSVWFSRVVRIRKTRETAHEDTDDQVEFIEELGAGWRSEVAIMERRLASVKRELNKSGKPQDGSTLAHVVRLLKSATASMIEELWVIRSIENATMVSEAEWIREEVAKVASGAVDRNEDHRRVWHQK